MNACPVCARQKSSNKRPAGLLLPLPIPARPWSHVSMDFITGLPTSRGNKVILVVVDWFSKAAHFVAHPKLPSARETADLVLQHVVRIHGVSSDMVADRGPQFADRFWKAFWTLFDASVSLSSGFHPQSYGQTERVNQDLKKYLRCFVSSNPDRWSQFLMWAELSYNTLQRSSTGMSPFECQFGFKPPLFPSQQAFVAVPSVEVFVFRCRRALSQATSRHQRQANPHRRPVPQLRPGQ